MFLTFDDLIREMIALMDPLNISLCIQNVRGYMAVTC